MSLCFDFARSSFVAVISVYTRFLKFSNTFSRYRKEDKKESSRARATRTSARVLLPLAAAKLARRHLAKSMNQ